MTRAGHSVPAVLVSYVLRVVDSEAAQGHLVGEIEDVRTGRTRTFRNSVELAEMVRDSRSTNPSGSADPQTTEAAPCPRDSRVPFD